MASGIYDDFKEDLMDASVNLSAGQDVLRVALMDNAHAFTASNSVWANVLANEITGTNYTANGEILTYVGPGTGISVAANTATWDADDSTWLTATFTAYHAVIYDTSNASPANSLVCSIDFGGAQAVAVGTFTIEWNSSGIISLT